jgi:MFS family permease
MPVPRLRLVLQQFKPERMTSRSDRVSLSSTGRARFACVQSNRHCLVVSCTARSYHRGSYRGNRLLALIEFYLLLRHNRNYRYTWMGQVVSEIGDMFNTIAVLSLTLHVTGSNAAVGGVMIARTLAAIVSAPIAGVMLDRLDRRRVMIWSDIVRGVFAAGFLLTLYYPAQWLLYTLSASLSFASPFFSAGRSAILPRIAHGEQLKTANALTQTTAWLTVALGAMLGGISADFGFQWAFAGNTLSFVFSAFAIWQLNSPDGFRAARAEVEEHAEHRAQFWNEFTDSLRYMKATPLILAIALSYVGWATGGGAAQILFTLLGERVFLGGPKIVGLIWGFAGVGLVIGGFVGHFFLRRLNYGQYLHAIWINYLIHGISYALFSVGNLAMAIVFITISRLAIGTNNVLNRTILLTHVPDHFRGRVFTTVEGLLNATMLISLTLASFATMRYPIRAVGVVAGLMSASTAIFWAWAVYTRRLPEPALQPPPAAPLPEKPVTPA